VNLKNNKKIRHTDLNIVPSALDCNVSKSDDEIYLSSNGKVSVHDSRIILTSIFIQIM
jgi:hypothetical protein